MKVLLIQIAGTVIAGLVLFAFLSKYLLGKIDTAIPH